ADLKPFVGAGIYLIYYRGGFNLYKPLTDLNRREFVHPLYVGQAVSPGGRKGGFSEITNSPSLFSRLAEHTSSVRLAENLNLDDIACRFLVVDEFWISLAESLLIESYRPL